MTSTQLPTLDGAAFGDLVDALPIAMVVCDDSGEILHANPALLDLVGDDANGWLGRLFVDLPLTAVGASQPEVFVATAGGVRGRFERTQVTVAGADGLQRVVHVLDRHGSIVGDVLHPLAAVGGRPHGIDAESGVPDQASVSHVLHSEVARCRRYGNPLAVIVLELGAFGGAGLETAQALAPAAVVGQLLAEQTRWADSVGRWSDNRFVLVLPETPLASAARLIDKIRAAVIALEVENVEIEIKLSCSQWVKGDDVRALIARAEAGFDSEVPGDAPEDDGDPTQPNVRRLHAV